MRKLIPFILLFIGSFSSTAQSISATGSLNVPRWGHRSQLLYNGNVLVVGGNNGYYLNTVRFSSAEIYNPTTKIWSFTGSMTEERDDFSSVVLNDGTVLAIGGINQKGELLSSCEFYNASTGAWQKVNSMIKPRVRHAAVKLKDGKVLVAGGVDGNDSEIYDPFNNSWTSTGKMQLEHGAGLAMIVLDDGTVLATGGDSYPTRAEIYDPVSQKWTLLNAKTARKHYYHSIVRLRSGDFLIVGTQSFDAADQLSAEIYNPTGKYFYSTGNLLTNVGIAPLVALDEGKVLLYGYGDILKPTDTKVVQIYNPNGTWSAYKYNFFGANLATANLLPDATVLLAGGSLTTGNGATGASYLVTQDGFTFCRPSDRSLTVKGSINCNGKPAVVTLPATEPGTSYMAYIGDEPISNISGGISGPLTINLYQHLLAPGKNVIRVKAIKLGCPGYFLIDTAMVDITMPAIAKPTVSVIGSTVFCHGGSVELSAPAGMAGYEWNTGHNTQKITVTNSGYYRVRVKNASGCFSPYSEVVEVSVTPGNIVAGPNQTVCVNRASFLLPEFSPAAGTWSGPGVSPEGIFNPAVAGVGEHQLSYSLCGNTSRKTVTVTPLPKVTDFTLKASEETICYQNGTRVVIESARRGVKYEIWKEDKLFSSVISEGFSLDFNTGSLTQDTRFIVKGISFNDCGTDTLAKSINITLHINPHLKVQTQTPFVCRKDAGLVYVVKSQRDVVYQLKRGNINIGSPKAGNGDTLKFNTGSLLETTTFRLHGTKTYCSTTLLQSVKINVSGPSAYFTVNTYNPEAGEEVKIINNSLNEGGRYEWDFGPGASIARSSEKSPPSVTFNTPGTYNLKLTCTGPEGCTDVLIRKITVISPVTKTNNSYSVSSGSFSLNSLAVAYDNEDNSFLLLDDDNIYEGYGTYHYGPQGDGLNVEPELQDGYDNRHTLVKYNAKGIIQWATSLRHASGWAKGGDIAPDKEGNIYLSYHHGEHIDSVQAFSTDGSSKTFDPPHDTNGNTSVVILKYNKDGIFQWHNTYLEHYTNYKVSLSLDKNLNVYAGSSSKICKIDKNGVMIWSRSKGYSDVEVDSKGYIWGLRYGQLVVDKYNAEGDLLFSTQEPIKAGTTALNISPWYLKLDNKDNLYIGGEFNGEFIFNTRTVSDIYVGGNLHNDLFLCQIKNNGSQGWIKQISIDHAAYLKGMDLKKDKLVFLAGAMNTNIGFNPLPNNSYKDNLFINQGGGIIGSTDTTAAGSMRIIRVNEGRSSVSIIPDNLLAFSKQSENILFGLLFKDGLLLGKEILIKPVLTYQGNLITVRTDFNSIFNPVPPVSQFTSSGPQCPGATIIFTDVSGGNPDSWSWHFPGGSPATSTERNPIVTFSQPGTYTVSLTTSNAFGQGSTYTQNVLIESKPVINITPGTVCKGADITLTATGAVSYTWGNNESGASYTLKNVQNDTTITVKGVNASGCESVISHTIKVSSGPEVRFLASLPPICKNAAAVDLPAASPAGGSYSGPGVMNGKFDPVMAQPGINTITYRYTDFNRCTGFATTTVMVSDFPVVTLGNLSSVCENQLPVNLGGGLPTGGTYSGVGVANGVFTPSTAGVGTHVITYSFNQNGCIATATKSITVTAMPSIPITGNLILCQGATATALTATGSNLQWYTQEIAGTALATAPIPNTATIGITHYYVSQKINECEGQRAKVSVTIIAPPTVSLSAFKEVCSTIGDLALTGGQPAGGAYSGTGVNNGIFNATSAGIGSHIITYTYSANGCTATAAQEITVSTCTGIKETELAASLSIYPNPTDDKLQIILPLKSKTAIKLRLINNKGQIVWEKSYSDRSGEFNQVLDFKGKVSGIYMLQLFTEQGVIAKRVIIK